MSESPETLIHILWSIIGAVGVAALGLLSWGVKRLIATAFENTIQIRMLNQKLEEIIGSIMKINRIEQDLNHAHAKIRELNQLYRNGE